MLLGLFVPCWRSGVGAALFSYSVFTVYSGSFLSFTPSSFIISIRYPKILPHKTIGNQAGIFGANIVSDVIQAAAVPASSSSSWVINRSLHVPRVYIIKMPTSPLLDMLSGPTVACRETIPDFTLALGKIPYVIHLQIPRLFSQSALLRAAL